VIIGRERPAVVDSHVHFWDPAAREHAWLAADARLDRPFGPADFAAETGGVVDGVVAVQADCRWDQAQDEASWFGTFGDAEVPVVGIVAAARLESPDIKEHLGWLRDQPLVVGVRRLLQDEPPGFATSDAFVEGVRSLADHGLTMDLCVRDHQLAEVTELVRLCPEVTFVLDHCGKPDIRGGGYDDWAADLARLAELPRVACKLSGLLSEADAASASSVPAYLAHVLEIFGPERCLFGSDWPVCTTAGSWTEWWEIVDRLLAPLGAHDKALVLGQTAVRTYGLSRTQGGGAA
jgi:L-fuconolactonase